MQQKKRFVKKVCTEKVCRNVRAEFVPKLCTQKCAENVHTQNVQNCAKMCTRKMCRIVRGEFCADLSCGSFCELCAELCPRIVSTQKFPVMHIRKFYVREHCPTCVQKVLSCVDADLHKLYMSENVPRLSHVQNVKNGPKMTKNDQNRQFGQNVPKWPKMAQNGRKCPGWVHDWSPAPCD